MAYMMVANGDNFDVVKQDDNGKPMGKALNKKPMGKPQASAFISSMMADDATSGKSLSETDLLALEEKCSDMSYMPPMPMKLDDADPRVNYDPLGGRSGAKACANCRWFHPSSASCDLVYGPIVATGLSDLWLAAELPAPTTPTQQPMPVYLVNVDGEPDIDDMDSGQMSLDGKAADPAGYAYVPDKKAPSTWKLPIGDAQHARLALAAIGSNPPHGNKVDIPAADMPGVRKKIEAAIRKHVTDKNEVKKLLGGKSLLEQFIEFIGVKSTDDSVDDGFKVMPDGRWRAWWTNNAKDRTGETFSAKSIDDYIARVEGGKVPYPELWYKHLPIRMGKADALARIGYLTFATGTFYDTLVGQRGKAYLESEQKAGHPKTNSHGYLYPTNLRVKGVYNAFNTFEITVLDPGEEANSITLFEVKTMFAKLDQKKFDDLVKIFGKDEVEKLVNFADTKSRELEAAGVDLKSFSSFEGVELQDKEAHAAIKALAEVATAGFKKIDERLDAIVSSVEGVKADVDKQIAASTKAVADLKAFVDEQFGMAPRASKAAATQLSTHNPQVTLLAKANADAASVKEDSKPEDMAGGKKSILDLALDAALKANS